jgi:uncharacterized protein (DUF1015 family)
MNASPVVLLFSDAAGEAARALESATRLAPVTDLTDDGGVRHRLWQLPVEDLGAGPLAATLLEAGAAGPLTIADGHHRYETALRYHDERHRDRQRCELAPFDYLLALLVSVDQPLTVLPTHRVLRDGLAGESLVTAAAALFDVERLPARAALLSAFAGGTMATANHWEDVPPAQRPHRIGLWTGGVPAMLHARGASFEPLLDGSGSPYLRWLDVNLLAVALQRLFGVDRAATAGGGRIGYTQDPVEALDLVDRGEASSAFLLAPTPVADVLRVAAAGEVMPPKSTYFYPKQLTGLVLNPHEW